MDGRQTSHMRYVTILCLALALAVPWPVQGELIDLAVPERGRDRAAPMDIQNAWVRSITTRHFSFGAVHARAGTKWVTVQDANNYDPVSEIVGGRRYAFFNQGQLNLFRNLDTSDGRHDLATDRAVEGPNVFVDGRILQSYDEVGPHAQWATGFLFDNISVTQAGTYFRRGGLNLYNRGNTGEEGNPLHGWTSANSVLWNSTAYQMHVENPPTAQNWSVGGQADIADGTGYTDSFGTPVEMRSLYYAQLQRRRSTSAPYPPA
jgi:hypothetical protein